MINHTATRPLAALALTLGLTTGLTLGLALGAAIPAFAQDKTIATVNGKPITEADLKLAEAEVGGELGPVPDGVKRRLLMEFMIENMVFAEAAEAAKLGTGPAFDARMKYLRQRALRDLYFDTSVRGAVKDEDAKKFYDEQLKGFKGDEEVNARHILVDEKAKADDIAAKLKAGGDFAALAKEHSKDPGSKDNGGSLGFFGKGQMVPQFEEAAFKMNKGDVSPPVQSQFGWHIIKLDDKRMREPPPFEQVKDRIVQSLVGQKAQTIAGDLRGKAKIDIVDPEIKKTIEAEAPKKP